MDNNKQDTNKNTPNNQETTAIDDKKPKASTVKFLNDNLQYQQIPKNSQQPADNNDEENQLEDYQNGNNNVNQITDYDKQLQSKQANPEQTKDVMAEKAGSEVGSKAGATAGSALGGPLGAKIGSKVGSVVGSKVGSKIGSNNKQDNNPLSNKFRNNKINNLINKNKQSDDKKQKFQSKNSVTNGSQNNHDISKNTQNNHEENNQEQGNQSIAQKFAAKRKEKIKAFIISKLPIILPIVLVIVIIIIIALILFYAIVAIFGDEDVSISPITVDYCDTVNLDYDDQTTTVTDQEYIAYEIANSKVANLNSDNTLEALSIILRTNLYANTNSISNHICSVKLEKEYKAVENEKYLNIVEATGYKVFAFTPKKLTELPYTEYFSYKDITQNASGNDGYNLYVDKYFYLKDWVDKYIPSEMINQDKTIDYGFSVYGAYYLNVNDNENTNDLLYHYYVSVTNDPNKMYGSIYRIDKSSTNGGTESSGTYSGVCSSINMHSTNLTEAEFTQKLQAAASKNGKFSVFYQEASQIYKLATSNNVNPELVAIRAEAEGFSPGSSKNNYWGIGCVNNGGYAACLSYSSFDSGVNGFINNIKKYNSVQEMMGKYAYIGSHWFSPGDSANGGCYYFEYIKKYMSADRASAVAAACANSCSGSSCLATTAEDQLAYSTWQVADKMIPIREEIFGIGSDNCDTNTTGDASLYDIKGSGFGAKVAKYAIETFDSYHYSQAMRELEGYVDCSSMVARAYKHFGLIIYTGGDNTGGEYTWCKNNGKLIEAKDLQAGDLIFYNSGYHYDRSQVEGIGHVTMYIGNNEQFSARSSHYAYPDQVAVTKYNGDGNIFCRPSK
jgi:outer membrane lipoprotein SlyB